MISCYCYSSRNYNFSIIASDKYGKYDGCICVPSNSNSLVKANLPFTVKVVSLSSKSNHNKPSLFSTFSLNIRLNLITIDRVASNTGGTVIYIYTKKEGSEIIIPVTTTK